MILLSWNVNGIRAIAKKGFLGWLQKTSPDILCLQETKCHPDQLGQELLKPFGYMSYWSSAEKKGYSGVCVYTKKPPINISEKIGKKEFDREGRNLILDFGDFVLFNIYFPNGSSGNVRVPYKMAFYEHFLKVVETYQKDGRKVIICGDVNTAHKEIDLARPKENQKNTGFLPEERAWVTKLIAHGFVDTFRCFHQEGGHYTWWDYFTAARARDVGWRIDYFFVTENLQKNLKSAFILKDVMGSDHCPIGIEIK